MVASDKPAMHPRQFDTGGSAMESDKENTSTRRRFLAVTALAAGNAALLGSLRTPALAAPPPIVPAHCAPPSHPVNPIPFTPDQTRPILLRKAAQNLSNAEVQLFRNAVQAMRTLTLNNPSDPRGWQQQANVHGWNCGGCLDNLTAPLTIHNSSTFFLWHRAYLYFFERILGALAGQPNLRLPYWQWDDPTQLAMPGIYTNPGDPLFDPTRQAQQLDSSIADATVMQGLYALTSFDQFGGDQNSNGNVEVGPHNAVHITVEGDMGAFGTAAQDPIFYAHHTNVDRVWAIWAAANPQAGPTDQWLLNQQFTFFDENQNWVSIKASDVLDYENNLRFRY